MPRKQTRGPGSMTITAGVCGALTWAGVAAAQGTQPEQTREASRGLLEEIVVTADRKDSFGADFVQAGTFRNARAIDIPLTVAVMPRELLDAQQAYSMGDAVRNSAGVTFSQVSPAITSNLSIRGIPVENRSNYRMNGSLPIVNLIDLPLEDKERIEVLKGVSSLYYGFTTPAGIVNLTMKRATTEPVLAVNLTGNEHGAFGGHVDVGHRFLDDRLGVRVNAVHGSVEPGIQRVGGDRTVGALALDFVPADSVTISVDVEYIHKKQSEGHTVTLTPGPGGITSMPPLLDGSQNLASEWMYNVAEELNVLGHVEWRFSENWSILAQAGRSDLTRDRRFNSFRNFDPATGNGILRVSLSRDNEAVNENYRTELAGAFQTGPFVHQISFGLTGNTRTAAVPAPLVLNLAQNYFDPVEHPETPFPPLVVPNPTKITDDGYYVFNRSSYKDWLDILVGLRRTDYTNRSVTSLYEAKETSPSYGVVVKPKPWFSVYATYIEGLEEGGVAGLTVVNPGEILPPATTEQKELGIKVEPTPGLLLTLAYFDIDRASAFVNAENRFVQDGRTSFVGWEASAAGEIGERWSIFASAMELDAELENAADPLVIGNRPENTPERTGSLFIEYRPAFVEGLGLSAGLFYIGDRPVNSSNAFFIDSYTTYDVGARYTRKVGENVMTVRLKIDNVTDEKYWAATGASLLAQGLPRTVKFSVGMQF